jgi:hypothetical protein
MRVTLALKNFVGLFQVIRDLFCFVLFFFRGVRVSASFPVTREESMHGQSDVPSCTRLCSALSTHEGRERGMSWTHIHALFSYESVEERYKRPMAF